MGYYKEREFIKILEELKQEFEMVANNRKAIDYYWRFLGTAHPGNNSLLFLLKEIAELKCEVISLKETIEELKKGD